MKIAVIPARGCSKRIPYKNIRYFAGKPMLAHAICIAQESGLFDHIVVSTDDSKIANIAAECDANVQFGRPAELAEDHTPTVPVISHAIKECQALGWQVDQVCCIYPTTPFLQSADLVAALGLLEANAGDYVYPVANFPSAIQRALRRLPDGLMEPFNSQFVTARTQDLEPAYYDAGQFYWGYAQTWTEEKDVHKHGAGLVVPSWRAVDIDTVEDWERAELLYAALVDKKYSE